MPEPKVLRCAIYTRVSTDAGLEQDFNSLDAQREAAEAYIKSQAHEGWKLLPQAYNDGGFSGGSLERPALGQLLKAVKAGHVDVIVVYKVDRLTRSLADFAKLVELFDQHSTSFVSVTQAFNTTSSMGRLTLNVLLSFAQFEREVTAERIRDKIAASKKRGIWMGGNPPLGYRVQDRKLLIEPSEAETVKLIFRRYLELGSSLPLLEELHRTGVRTRKRQLSSGKIIGGVPFMRGPLNHLLRNRMYLGEMNHHEKSYPGEHDAIIDIETFEAVQAKLNGNVQTYRNSRVNSDAALMGKLFDDRGNLMTPTHAKKRGVRYRYYACRLLFEGRRREAGSVQRVPAVPIEKAIADAIRSYLKTISAEEVKLDILDDAMLRSYVSRAVLHPAHILVSLAVLDGTEISVSWKRQAFMRKREILLPHADPAKDGRPIKNEIRKSVVKAVATSRLWLAELIANPLLTIEALALREGRSKRSICMLLSLSAVSPEIVRALISGQLPRGIGITKLVNLPLSWKEQRNTLGLAGSCESAALCDLSETFPDTRRAIR